MSAAGTILLHFFDQAGGHSSPFADFATALNAFDWMLGDGRVAPVSITRDGDVICEVSDRVRELQAAGRYRSR